MVLVENDHHHYTQSDLKCMNMLRHPIWIFDIDYKTMFWANQSALVVWNASTLDELLQRDYASDMSEASALWMKDFKTNRLSRNEYTTERWTFYPRGHAIILDCAASAIRIDDGRIAILVEAEIIEHQSTVSENTARGIEILKHLPVAVSQFTMDGKLMYQNPQATKLFGSLSNDDDTVANDTYASSNDNTIQHNSALHRRFVDAELGQFALLKIQNDDDDIFSAETQQYTIVQEDDDDNEQTIDNSRWFNVVLRRTRDPVTSDVVILYIARDISDIVKARKDTFQATMKSEFLDVMAHEIRTPLHQIVGFIDLLEDSKLDDDQLYSVQQIQNSCSLLMSIINDLLDCSKLEHGQLQIEHLSFELQSLIESCMASIAIQAKNKNLIVSYNIDPNCTPKYIVSDPNRLRQILQNLLSNSLKFTNTGSITVNIKPTSPIKTEPSSNQSNAVDTSVDQWLRFEVTDTGIGIDPTEQAVVFERYRQANSSVARQFGGTGLGLPICKGLVELLGGNIELHSEVGIGTTVIFEIPIRGAQNESDLSTPIHRRSFIDPNSISPSVLQQQQQKQQEHDEFVPLNVLVVEDNKINQKVVKAMLQRMGHTVTLAENGEIALNEISQQSFHIVLMDIQMPVMDGIECTKKIRNDLHLSKEQLPVIGLTAGYQNSDRDYYEYDVGMNDCLGKPLPMEKLKQAIALYQ